MKLSTVLLGHKAAADLFSLVPEDRKDEARVLLSGLQTVLHGYSEALLSLDRVRNAVEAAERNQNDVQRSAAHFVVGGER